MACASTHAQSPAALSDLDSKHPLDKAGRLESIKRHVVAAGALAIAEGKSPVGQ